MNHYLTSKCIHLWYPNIFEFKGGIQVYCATFLEALQSLYPDKKYEIFIKHDTQVPSDFPCLDSSRFHFSGIWPYSLRTSFFAGQLLGQGLWQHPQLIVASHINFTPVAYWLKQIVGIPYWTIAYGVDAWNINRPALKTAVHHADRILSISEYTRDRLIKEQNLDPAKIFLLPCTFDVSNFQIAPKSTKLLHRYNLNSDQQIILTVARLDSSERYKGYDRILQALPEIRRHIPDVHYMLVGKGNDRSRIEQLISQLNLQDCVTLAGFVPDSEIADYYNLCDVFAMPSKGEGFGIVYLEALACGKPTLGGDRDGAIDALCHGELGVLVNPDDVYAITQSLVKILQGTYEHPILYKPEILRQKVIDIFGFERFKQNLAAVLQTSNLTGV